MSSTIRPDEIAKYAPRRSFDGTVKLKDIKTLPVAPQLTTTIQMSDPPWRGPSPFEGEARQWRMRPLPVPQATMTTGVFGSGRISVGFIEGLFSTAAVLSFGVIATVGLGLVLFPNAPHGANQNHVQSAVAPTPSATTTQLVKLSPVKSAGFVGVSDLWPLDPPATQAATPAPKLSNAVYVASAAPSALPPASVQPQQQPDPQQLQQAQLQRYATQVGQPSVSPSTPIRPVVSPEKIDELLKRAEAFLAQGDVATARVWLERAAETRDPRAALTLASTYDPNVLGRMGAIGIRPDAAQAHAWYERAAEFGSGEASQRLTALAQLNR